MTKEMLFLAEIYTNWCKSQGLPDYMSADDLRSVSYTHLTLPTIA